SRPSNSTLAIGERASTSMRWSPQGLAESGHLFGGPYARDSAADDDRYDGTRQQAGRKERQAGLETVGGMVLQPAYREGADEAAKVADGIDEGNPAGRGHAAQVSGGHGPEHGLRAVHADCRDGDGNHRQDRRADVGAGNHADRRERQRACAVKDALARLVRM